MTTLVWSLLREAKLTLQIIRPIFISTSCCLNRRAARCQKTLITQGTNLCTKLPTPTTSTLYNEIKNTHYNIIKECPTSLKLNSSTPRTMILKPLKCSWVSLCFAFLRVSGTNIHKKLLCFLSLWYTGSPFWLEIPLQTQKVTEINKEVT